MILALVQTYTRITREEPHDSKAAIYYIFGCVFVSQTIDRKYWLHGSISPSGNKIHDMQFARYVQVIFKEEDFNTSNRIGHFIQGFPLH